MGKKELDQKQSFLKRHFNGIALTAVVLIPTIYTTLFLGSMWDPYGNVDQLPVAVVNQDIPVEYAGSTLAVGKELTEKLEENRQLDFHFVDAAQAAEGLDDGTYYMTITIPSDFSENAATLLEDDPQKMQLRYSTNPGVNYIASKMSESALTKIEKEISASVTKEYTETIFHQLGDIGSGMTEAADGANAIQDGAVQLIEGNDKITENLTLLSNSTLTFQEGAKSLEDGLQTYTAGVSTVNDGASALSDGMNQLAAGADTLSSGASDLKNGTKTLSVGVTEYTGGVTQAYEGAKQLDGNSVSLENGAASLNAGAYQLSQGSDAMAAGLETLSATLDGSLSQDSMTQIAQVNAGLTQLQQGIQTLDQTLSTVELPDTDGLVQTLTKSLTVIGTSAQDAGLQLQTMQTSMNAMMQTAAFQSLEPAAQQELLGCFSQPMTSLAGDVSAIGTEVSALSDTLQNTDLGDSADAMTQLKTSVSTLAAGANQALPGAQKAIDSLSSGLQSVQQAVDQQLVPGAQEISSGLNTLYAGSNTLYAGVSSYTGGVSDLKSGLETLHTNSAALSGGAKALEDGADTLTNNLPTLTGAVSQLQSGAMQLKLGTEELVSNNGVLCDGASQLSDGAGQIQDGASQLADGSTELGDGLETLSGGAVTLQSALSDGAQEVNDVNATDLTYDMFSSPVESQEIFASKVANNGNAMAAYMMAVGLWVAGLAFCVMLSPHDQKIKGRNAGHAWAMQLGKLWALAIIQALLMILFLSLFNGFAPENLAKTMIVACISSIAFLTMEYCVNYLMGIVGSFVLLVFMVLQLSGCAGTYPKELSVQFYQWINPFMPFTYTVHGFRSGIASGQDITLDCIVLAVIAVVFAGVLLVGFHARFKRQGEVEERKASVSDRKLVQAEV